MLTLVSLYNSLFLSFLNYGISALGLTYESYLNPLFNLRKKILHCIKFEPFVSPSMTLFQSFKALKIVDILHLNILTCVYKSLNKLSPSRFHDYFQTNSSVHRIGTRQATRGNLFKPIKNTTMYSLQAIQYFDSKLWNTLPLFISVAGSTEVFCSKLKSYLLDSYSQN